MRSDPLVFSIENTSPAKRLRAVIRIEYDVESMYLTSHPGITGVPGVVFDDVLQAYSAISQKLFPDEGRSEIGSLSLSFIDKDSQFTQEMRERLQDGIGLRGRKVRLYIGYEHKIDEEGGGFGTWGETFGYGTGEVFSAKFNEFRLFQTQIITEAQYKDGVYSIECNDITREQAKDIFEQKRTTLRDTLAVGASTILVGSTAGFQPVWHGGSYSDAPNQKVGYVRIDNEIIRYTGITDDSFTGCTRGVLNTREVEHVVDSDSDPDRRPAVEEEIYIELPAPKLCYALLTGIIHGTSPTQTFPPHWHMGIDPDLVRLSDFTGIGVDLWDTLLDSEGFVVRFQGLKKTEGKAFIESELYLLCGCYSPIYADGTIGLKRMSQVLADAPFVRVLDRRNISSHAALKHEFSRMYNEIVVEWNWNGERFTRKTQFLDANSIATHGRAPPKVLQFKGLSGSRHTPAIIRKRIDFYRDRFTSPPETTSVELLPSQNVLELGDVIRDRMRGVRDWNGTTQDIDRSFEIQNLGIDFQGGKVTADLFGSAAAASVEAPNHTGDDAALPDAFYSTEGTNLASVCTIVVTGGVGEVQPGTYDLPAGIYYYLGDLTIADGATFTVNATVQLRIRGFLTINGDIDGVGRGKAGQADTAEFGSTVAGLPGFMGSSRGMDGVFGSTLPRGGAYVATVPCAAMKGTHDGFPRFELTVDGLSLIGVPTDLAGTSGGAGGKLVTSTGGQFNTGNVSVVGGTGADSGAGLIIINRGLGFGASGSIDLSGDDSAATSLSASGIGFGFGTYPGAGGAGCPGALLILLDGSSVDVPDVGGRFTAVTGTVPVNGTPLPQRGPEGFGTLRNAGWLEPGAGYLDDSMVSAEDSSNSMYSVQFIPAPETPQEDQNLKPPAPTSLEGASGNGFNYLTWVSPPADTFDEIEVYASITNVRGDAVKVGSVRGTSFSHNLPVGGTRYYWIRARRFLPGIDVYSDFEPFSPTGGEQQTAANPVKFVATGACKVSGSVVAKIGGGTGYNSGFYSLDSYSTDCHIAFKCNQTDSDILVGLDQNPTEGDDFTLIDHAIYAQSDGDIEIYESGTLVGVYGEYTTATELAVRRNGSDIEYLVDRQVVETTSGVSGTFFARGSFEDPGGTINSVRFNPGTDLDTISTPQIGPNAATAVYKIVEAGPINYGIPGFSVDVFDALTLTIPAQPETYTWIISFIVNAHAYSTGPDEAAFMYLLVTDDETPADVGAQTDRLVIEKSSTFRRQVLRAEFTPPGGWIGAPAYIHLAIGVEGDIELDLEDMQIIVEVIKR